jgi:hypothetical protein
MATKTGNLSIWEVLGKASAGPNQGRRVGTAEEPLGRLRVPSGYSPHHAMRGTQLCR